MAIFSRLTDGVTPCVYIGTQNFSESHQGKKGGWIRQKLQTTPNASKHANGTICIYPDLPNKWHLDHGM